MLNLTTTTKRLKIGKIKLYELLEITGIEPVVKGRSKFITDEQFGLLRQAFRSNIVFQDESNRVEDEAQDESKTKPEQNSELIKTLNSEIEHLRKLLERERELLTHEQAERQSERVERENYQAMVMMLQKDNQSLRQQLLAAPEADYHQTQSSYRSNEPERNKTNKEGWFQRIFA